MMMGENYLEDGAILHPPHCVSVNKREQDGSSSSSRDGDATIDQPTHTARSIHLGEVRFGSMTQAIDNKEDTGEIRCFSDCNPLVVVL